MDIFWVGVGPQRNHKLQSFINANFAQIPGDGVSSTKYEFYPAFLEWW